MDSGPCSMFMQRYFYDAEAGYCKPFSYGGCEGNRNRFQTLELCTQECGRDVVEVQAEVEEGRFSEKHVFYKKTKFSKISSGSVIKPELIEELLILIFRLLQLSTNLCSLKYD